jgi:DNA-directed RNA polymerase subunit RPC12/RpoP
MPELNLTACPICQSSSGLSYQSKSMQGQPFTWYECREYSSVLLWVGENHWMFQRMGRQDKAYLLKRPMTAEALYDLTVKPVSLAVPSIQPASEPATPPVSHDTNQVAEERIQCPRCNTMVLTKHHYCTVCGNPLESLQTPQLANDNVCPRCGRKRSWHGLNFHRTTGRCLHCEGELRKAKRRFQTLFLQASADGVLDESKWKKLEEFCVRTQMPLNEALQSVQAEALNLVQRTLTFAKEDEVITPDEEAAIYALQRRLLLTNEEIKHIRDEIEYVKLITNIRQGNIPPVKTSVILDADEFGYWEAPTVYMKPLKSGPTPHNGRMIITNKKVMFVAPHGGMQIPVKTIVRVAEQHNGVFLELSRRTGNGF